MSQEASTKKSRRAAGGVLTVIGLAHAIYSFPFVTFVAFGVFLLGLMAALFGLWLALKG